MSCHFSFQKMRHPGPGHPSVPLFLEMHRAFPRKLLSRNVGCGQKKKVTNRGSSHPEVWSSEKLCNNNLFWLIDLGIQFATKKDGVLPRDDRITSAHRFDFPSDPNFLGRTQLGGK